MSTVGRDGGGDDGVELVGVKAKEVVGDQEEVGGGGGSGSGGAGWQFAVEWLIK